MSASKKQMTLTWKSRLSKSYLGHFDIVYRCGVGGAVASHIIADAEHFIADAEHFGVEKLCD
jgi:hypothetical protein